MRLIIIAAMNTRRVIGRNGTMPWHLPEDLGRFKSVTMGGTVVMGRKTFASIGHPLPGRRNIILSRTMQSAEGAEIVRGLEEALAAAAGDDSVFIIGGAELYRDALERADELQLTIVDDPADGDTFFPPYEHLIGTRYTEHRSEERDGYRVITYIRSDGRPAVR